MNPRLRFFYPVAALLMSALGIGLWITLASSGASSSLNIPLIRPEVAYAQSGFLEAEAGMAGYTKLKWATPVDQVWADVKRQFGTIEKETGHYLIGTVRLSGYYTWWDPHVYLDKDGWLVMYYPKAWAPALMVDVKGTDTTTFGRVAKSIAAAGGASYPPLQLYHFEFPQANRIVVASTSATPGGTASFSILVPGAVSVLSKSYVFWNGADFSDSRVDQCGNLVVGETSVASGRDRDVNLNVNYPKVGHLKAAQIVPDVNTNIVLHPCDVREAIGFTLGGYTASSAKASFVLITREP